jgi:hypothetical protein
MKTNRRVVEISAALVVFVIALIALRLSTLEPPRAPAPLVSAPITETQAPPREESIDTTGSTTSTELAGAMKLDAQTTSAAASLMSSLSALSKVRAVRSTAATSAPIAGCFLPIRIDNVPTGTVDLVLQIDGAAVVPISITKRAAVWTANVAWRCGAAAPGSVVVTFTGSHASLDASGKPCAKGATCGPVWVAVASAPLKVR